MNNSAGRAAVQYRKEKKWFAQSFYLASELFPQLRKQIRDF